MLGLVYQRDGVEEKESQSNKSEAMNIKLDLEVASWRSIWLLMPVGKNEVLNNGILHWGREDSSTPLLPKQHHDTPVSSYLSVRPCPTKEEKLMSLFSVPSSLAHPYIMSFGTTSVPLRAIRAAGGRWGLPFQPTVASWVAHVHVVNQLHVLTCGLR